MTDTTKIALGLGLGLVLLVGGIIIYQNNQPKPKPHPDAEEDEYMTDETEEQESKTPVNGSAEPTEYTEMGLLERRVALLKVRDNFKDPSAVGYDDYMLKTKQAIEETHNKELVFYNTDTSYILADYNDNIKALINKEA